MRVGILGLLHQSNSFQQDPTTIEHFRRDTLLMGDEIRERFAGRHHEIAGFLEGLQELRCEPVPLFLARALPYGPIEADALRLLLEMMFEELESHGPLDGVLVAAHGTTVGEAEPDADGYWLALLRDQLGEGMPIIGTLDPHANLSRRVVESCDAWLAFRTNPHVDQRERGLEAARLMGRTLRGEIWPTQAMVHPPLLVGVGCQNTAVSPGRELLARADEMLDSGEVLSNSVLFGFPYADVEHVGSSVLVVTDDDADGARRLARELAGHLWSQRESLVSRPLDVEKALAEAGSDTGPVCLLDTGDDVSGGATGDGTHLAHILREKDGDAFVCLYDPEAVEAVDAAEAGARVALKVGGGTDRAQGPPLEGEFTVVGMFDGAFEESEPRHGGLGAFDQGRTAVVRDDGGLTIMLTSQRMAPSSLEQLSSCGVDPTSFRWIVAKGVHAPVPAYEPICQQFVLVDTPGTTCVDLSRLELRRRRRPMFPFEPDTEWDPEADDPGG